MDTCMCVWVQREREREITSESPEETTGATQSSFISVLGWDPHPLRAQGTQPEQLSRRELGFTPKGTREGVLAC